ncbi:MAG: hypothetical protein V4526_01790 [Patescibacteria group bacterium]
MNKKEILTLSTALALFLLHLAAMSHHWYLRHWWFDIPMHFLGGVSIALAVQYIWFFFFEKPASFRKVVVYTFIGTLCWEVFEAHYDIAGAHVGTSKYFFDSIKDIIVGTIGALFVAGYSSLLVKYNEKKQ